MKKVISLMFLVFICCIGLACSDPEVSHPASGTWLSPGKVHINNLRPGSKVSQKIRIHNGSAKISQFSIYFRQPDYVETGFSVASTESKDWITIDNATPQIASGETKEISVVIKIPKNAQVPERFEFWIGVKDCSQTQLSTELCSRWLINISHKNK